MTKRTTAWLQCVFILCLAFLCLAACTSPNSTHILFIGNSFTYFNGGIDKQLKGLAPGSTNSVVAQGGYKLFDHWKAGEALRQIQQGGWDYVVLQEQSQASVLDAEMFFNATRDFDTAVRTSGAHTILLMTWEYPDSLKNGVTTESLSTAYQSVAAELGIQVAPAGLAFARSLQARPDLILNSQDGHPTIYGTYLAACVLYGTIFGKTPLHNPYSDRTISPEIQGFLQRIAAQTLGY
jgi:Domain of unknown function (DUF4886)